MVRSEFLSFLFWPLFYPSILDVEGFCYTHVQTLGRTPVDEWSALRKDLYLTTNNTHKRQTPMTPARFEPAIPASERPQNPRLTSCGRWECLGPSLVYQLKCVFHRCTQNYHLCKIIVQIFLATHTKCGKEILECIWCDFPKGKLALPRHYLARIRRHHIQVASFFGLIRSMLILFSWDFQRISWKRRNPGQEAFYLCDSRPPPKNVLFWHTKYLRCAVNIS